MFISALFIIARAWKQPKCPSADEWIRKLWHIYTMEYYSAIKKNTFESVLMRWMKLEPIIQSEVSQKYKDQYSRLKHIYKDGNDNPICKTEKETQMYRTEFWTLWEKARVGWSERRALKYIHYQVWNRSPVQVGCRRQVLMAGTLGWPRGMGWEGGSGWGTHVNPWLIHVNVWQKPLQYCKVISLQIIKIKIKIPFQPQSSKASVLQHSYMNIGKAIALTRWNFVDKVMSLILLSSFVDFSQGVNVF